MILLLTMIQLLRLQSSPPQAPIFRGNSLLTLKSQRAHGFHPWAYITRTERKNASENFQNSVVLS